MARPVKAAPRTKRPPSPPATLADVVEELKALRRDMVVLCRVIVTNQKSHRVSLEQTIKRAEQPGAVNANVSPPSWYDTVFEADRDAGEG